MPGTPPWPAWYAEEGACTGMDGAANAEEGACTGMDGAANVWEVLEATILVSATLVVRIPMLVFWEAALPLLGGFLVAFLGGGG